MKKVTSVTTFNTAEGVRVSFTYSELDEAGTITAQNIRKNLICTDEETLASIEQINKFLTTKLEEV